MKNYFIMSWYTLSEIFALNIANVFYSKVLWKKWSFSSCSHVLIFLILAEGVCGAVWRGGIVSGANKKTPETFNSNTQVWWYIQIKNFLLFLLPNCQTNAVFYFYSHISCFTWSHRQQNKEEKKAPNNSCLPIPLTSLSLWAALFSTVCTVIGMN